MLLRLTDPRVLAALTLGDLEEFADAYEKDELRFISEVDVVEHDGPLDPRVAQLLLQTVPGAPYIEKRFVRMAKQAYGRGVFSQLKWAVRENDDGSVNVELQYKSGNPRALVPVIGHNVISRYSFGVEYHDFLYGNKDRELLLRAEDSQKDPDEPALLASYTDNTVNNGRNTLNVTAQVADQWRRRFQGRPEEADMRSRLSRLDLSYSWVEKQNLGLKRNEVGVSAGFLDQQFLLYRGDPTLNGTAPRSNTSQRGDVVRTSLFWANSDRDAILVPRRGWSTRVEAEHYFGDFDFTRVTLDARRYIPTGNLLGRRCRPTGMDGRLNDIRCQFPPASLAIQLQGSIANGDVPYSEEDRLDNSSIMRGLTKDRYIGIKKVGLRAEYRFALDESRNYEAFVFTDHAFFGEKMATLEAVDSYGLGTVLRLPIYSGIKAGAWYGRTFDGADAAYGLALGYMF